MRFARYLLLLPLISPLLGAQVAQVRAPVPAPSGTYLLHAVVPTNITHTGPVYVAGYPSASAVIGRTLDYAYHEVWASVPAGATGPFPVNTTGTAPAQLMIEPIMIQSLRNPAACVLEITDAQGTERFPITGVPTGYSRLIVNNAMVRTRYQFVSLGRFGNAQCWLTIRAGSRQIDVILNWNTGVPGSGDVLFNNAKIICPTGVRWIPNLADSTSQNGFLVKPTSDGRPHIITKMRDRPFRFSVLPDNYTYTAPWAWNGMAAWNWPSVPPCHFEAPTSITGANLDAEATTWRNSLQALQPILADTTSSGGVPVSHFWPAMGITYGGATSGIDMWPFHGIRWLVTGQVSGFERFAIESLRGRSRHRGSINEPSDGAPVRPDQHLENGQANWQMYNSVFQGNPPRDGLFDFPTTSLVSQAAYNPDSFDPTDCQHIVHSWNENAILAIAAADPLARYYLSMEAAKSLMTFWDGPGQAHRMDTNVPADKGTGLGRAECFAAMVMAHASVWGTDAERTRYGQWFRVFVDHLDIAQMPSGLFQVNLQAKEAKNPPFSDTPNGTPNYVIGSGLEECYIAAALSAAAGVDSYARTKVPQLLRQQAPGMASLAWRNNTCGTFSHTARGPNNGSGLRYTSAADWPAALTTGMYSNCPTCPYTDCYHIGYLVTCLKRAGATQADELLLRYTRKPTVAEAVAEMRRWGTGGSGTPDSQFWMAIGEWSP
jgi:hypothetical protein